MRLTTAKTTELANSCRLFLTEIWPKSRKMPHLIMPRTLLRWGVITWAWWQTPRVKKSHWAKRILQPRLLTRIIKWVMKLRSQTWWSSIVRIWIPLYRNFHNTEKSLQRWLQHLRVLLKWWTIWCRTVTSIPTIRLQLQQITIRNRHVWTVLWTVPLTE